MRVRLIDIAKKLKVSKSTVSMALRDSHRVSAELRKKVRHTATSMGYVPDPFLSGLAAHSRSRVSVKDHGILAWINHWEHPEQLMKFREFEGYWRGASKAAMLYGYRLDDVRWERGCSPERFERILTARGIEGVLIPPHHEVLDWGCFDWSKFSVLRFGMSVQNPSSNLVTSDLFRAVAMAVEKIHEHGYRRIGLTVNKDFNIRLGGNFISAFLYIQKLLKLNDPIPPLETVLSHTEQMDANIHRQEAPLREWIERHRPDAILTADTRMPDAIRKLGLRIPNDIAIAGTSVLDIPVDAGIDQRSEDIGRIAVEMLVKQINISERGAAVVPCRILVESRWKDGASLPKKN